MPNQGKMLAHNSISLFLGQIESPTNDEQTEKSALDSESAENSQKIETNFGIKDDGNGNDNLKIDKSDNTEKLDSNISSRETMGAQAPTDFKVPCPSTPDSTANMVQCEFCQEEYSENRIKSHVIGVHGVYVPKDVSISCQNIKQPVNQNSLVVSPFLGTLNSNFLLQPPPPPPLPKHKIKMQENNSEAKKTQYHQNISPDCLKNNYSAFCKYCKNFGHFVKKCPVLAKQRCHKCNSFGHLTRNCQIFGNQNSKSNWRNPHNSNYFGSWHNQSNGHWAPDINQNSMHYPYF